MEAKKMNELAHKRESSLESVFAKRRKKRVEALSKDPQISVTLPKDFKIAMDNLRKEHGVRASATYLKQALNLLMALDTKFSNEDEISIVDGNGNIVIKGPLKNLIGR